LDLYLMLKPLVDLLKARSSSNILRQPRKLGNELREQATLVSCYRITYINNTIVIRHTKGTIGFNSYRLYYKATTFY
jgi:hypothetical protein